jgi:hypothetical protein
MKAKKAIILLVAACVVSLNLHSLALLPMFGPAFSFFFFLSSSSPPLKFRAAMYFVT